MRSSGPLTADQWLIPLLACSACFACGFLTGYETMRAKAVQLLKRSHIAQRQSEAVLRAKLRGLGIDV